MGERKIIVDIFWENWNCDKSVHFFFFLRMRVTLRAFWIDLILSQQWQLTTFVCSLLLQVLTVWWCWHAFIDIIANYCSDLNVSINWWELKRQINVILYLNHPHLLDQLKDLKKMMIFFILQYSSQDLLMQSTHKICIIYWIPSYLWNKLISDFFK